MVVWYLVYRGWYNCLIAPTSEACAKLMDFHRHCGKSESLRAVGEQSCICTACIELVKLHANGRIMKTSL